MSHSLRFQLMVLPSATWPEFVNQAQQAENMGFDMLGLADHFVDWTAPERPWFELWTHAAAIAQATSKIRICTCVAQIQLRDPATLANHALTVDHISNGRLELGLGIGIRVDPSYEMMGLENWSNGERVDRFGEYVEIVDQLLRNEVTTYQGRYYSVKEAVMNPRPIQQPRPPILIAAMGPRMLRRAARYADNWNSLSFLDTSAAQCEETLGRVAQVDDLCADLGRDPTTLRKSYQVVDMSGRTSGGRLRYYDSEQAFIDVVEPLIEGGISEFGLYYPPLPEQIPMMERIASDTIPTLKKKYVSGI
jgi:alkanesulfonate monooxygenase SsuD/methylene tetrahydromethanopterin reductase-like flavin-dependent oxidoreductase (luciferase family)